MLLNDLIRQNERDLPPVAPQACWPASRQISMRVTFKGDVQLTGCYKNNLIDVSCNVAHQTANWCFDSS